MRRLVYHAESDCIFEIKTELEWESCAENDCCDVTDDEVFETKFRELKAAKEKKQEKELPKIRTN